MADDLEAEVVSEHHDRITEAEHEAEAAAEEAQHAAHEAESIMAQLATKSDVSHEHPQYVRRDEIEPLIGDLVRRADEAARDAESAAREAASHATDPSPVGEPSTEPTAVDELPLPEPEAEPEYRYVRRHGRHERVKIA